MVMGLRDNLFAIGLSAAISCTAAVPIVPDSHLIHAEAQVYRASVAESAVTLTVVARFINTTPDTLVLHPCRQHPPYPLAVSLERSEGGVWRNVWSPVCTRALMLKPPRLPPGQTRTDTVRIKGFRMPNTAPQFPKGPVAGLYRLAYTSVYRVWYPLNPPRDARDRMGEPLADSLLVSNTFRVTE